MKKLIIILLLLSFITPLNAQFNKVGRTSLQFLKIGVGGRESAMGEACIANPQNINSLFWNPAGLTQLENFQVSFHYTKWFIDLGVIGAAAGVNLGDFGVIALNYIYLDYGNLEEALVTSPTGGLDTRTGRNFTGKDMSLGFAYAKKFTDKLSIGVNLRYLREDLFRYSTDLISFDVGSFYDTGWKGIRLAMSAQNFSTQARWLHTGEKARQTYELPLLFRIGWSIDLMGGEDVFLGGDPKQHKLTMNMDAIHSNDYAERLNIGIEYVFLSRFFLRGGYRFNVDEGELSAGIGMNANVSDYIIQFDYSYTEYDFLDSPHRFSLLFSF
ncbi:MAG: PorV/PorQ family protein [Melioribacteraceae bacterium]|nr:PorV/PorQ family protein [Melioribacteraceae bacterium]